MSKTTIPRGGITADAIDATLIADDAISEEHLDPTAITASTEKSTLVAADKFLIADSAASNAIKFVQQSNLGSGSHVKLSSGSASSAVNQDFQSFMDTSKYNTYMVHFSKFIGLQGNTLDFQFLQSDNSVSGAGYWGSVQGMRSSGTEHTDNYENQSEGKLGTGLAASSTDVGAYLFWIYNNPNSTTFGSSVYGHNWGFRADYSDVIFTDYHISFNNSNSVHGFRVHASGNDATTFDYTIWGIAK